MIKCPTCGNENFEIHCTGAKGLDELRVAMKRSSVIIMCAVCGSFTEIY